VVVMAVYFDKRTSFGCVPGAEMVPVLVAERKKRGLSRKELGAAMGVREQTVGALESGRRTAHMQTLRLWAQALGYDIKLELVQK